MATLTGRLARIIFALPFLIFGIMHLMAGAEMAGMLAGWPGAVYLIYFSGLCLILAAVAIIIDKKAKLASLLLALLLLIIVLVVHLPGLGEPATMKMAMTNTLKDLGLMGGALIVAGISTS
jgi:uncharacterized membrane protein YphA (DoxX/SURF4 family)